MRRRSSRRPEPRSSYRFGGIVNNTQLAPSFRPKVELLEERLQPGDTLLGLSAVSLWGFGFGSLAAFSEGGTLSLPGQHRILTRIGEMDIRPTGDLSNEIRSLGSESLRYANPLASLPATDSGFRLSGWDSTDLLAGQLARHRLAATAGPVSALSLTVAGPNAGVLAGPEGGRTVPALGPIDGNNATAQAPAVFMAGPPLSFDATSGQLAVQLTGGAHTVQETLTADGFLDVMLDGHHYSSDPQAPSFDGQLAGASRTTLTSIRVVGSGQDTLILGTQQLAGGLSVQTVGANLTVHGALQAQSIQLVASGFVTVDAGGQVQTTQNAAGGIGISAGVFVNSGQLHADGPSGGQIHIQAGNFLNAGTITADATAAAGRGGQVQITVAGSSVATTTASVSASSTGGPGGQITLDGGRTGSLFSSGRQQVTGATGGAIQLFGREMVLAGATLDASGTAGGGSVQLGGGQYAADTVTVTPTSILQADAVQQGDGGRVAVRSEQATMFAGTVSARGGRDGGSGGWIDLSGQGNLRYAGSADAAAPLGHGGTLLLDPKNLTIDATPTGLFPQFDLLDPHSTAGGSFGAQVVVLPNGNVVVTNPKDDFGGTNAGAAYLFDGTSGALLSALVGSHPNDQVGSATPYILGDGNYLILSPNWNNQAGAVTWANSSTGVSGTVSDANSLVGSNPGDQVGYQSYRLSVLSLKNGDYLILSPYWNGGSANGRGAVTWFNGDTGIQGVLSEANSLVGSNPGDELGLAQITVLSNGNYVIDDPGWNGTRGAVTWGNGSTGITGIVSDANSLVGSNPGDLVGEGTDGAFFGIAVLPDGNYVVVSPNWNANRGAVTWASGTAGVRGIVSEANSLVGSNPGDEVGFSLNAYNTVSGAVTALGNGNYVVSSPYWNGKRGAVTWVNGTTGITGPVSEANSLVGSTPGDGLLESSQPGDQVGHLIPLGNTGNYVVDTPRWNGNRGAVTWGNGSTGTTGVISDANSLVGSNPGDFVGGYLQGILVQLSITVLNQGNYVVDSPQWNSQRGAVTWGSGSSGVSGAVSEANSLVGGNPGDFVGGTFTYQNEITSSLTVLGNGNYVVVSPSWNDKRGAVTWANGGTGIAGTVSETNSLVGDYPGDAVGSGFDPYLALLTSKSKGSFVIGSPTWDYNRGALTWVDANVGITGLVSLANSLIGSNPGDQVGSVLPLSNGNLVALTPQWNEQRGAVTWINSSTGITGFISEANSLIGSDPGDRVGSERFVELSNGDFVVDSSHWNGNRGAVTWADGTMGITGIISEANSLVGSNSGSDSGSGAGDLVGAGGITLLPNGNYVVDSLHWNGERGAVTWGNGSTGTTGTVSAANSLVGDNAGDQVGSFKILPLPNGNYLLVNPLWNDKRGAVTWGNGSTGTSGTVSPANSLVGSNPGDLVGGSYFSQGRPVPGTFLESEVQVLSNGNYLVASPTWNGNRGAVTWGNGNTGVSGIVSDANSLVGSNPNDQVGAVFHGGIGPVGLGLDVTLLNNGNYVVLSPTWNGNRGAVTWGDANAGVHGVVSPANSLVGSNPGDQVGSIFYDGSGVYHPGVLPLSNDNYLVTSAKWNGGRGAVTWVSGTSGQTLDGQGSITPQNSLVGNTGNTGLSNLLLNPANHTFLAGFASDGGGRVSAGFTDANQLTYTLAQPQSVSITPTFLTSSLNTGTAVVLQASNDITVNAPIIVSAGGKGGSLTLQAGRSIVLNASITTDSGALTLLANDEQANGVVDAQRDPGPAIIAMAPGTTLNTGSGALSVTLRDGAGLTHPDSGAITLQSVTAGAVSVTNNGPSPGSDINVGTVTSSGPQSYASANGTITVSGNLTAADQPIAFSSAVTLTAGSTLNAGAGTVNFAGGTVRLPAGVVSIPSGVTFSSASTLVVSVNGTDPGSFGQLVVGGPISLGGSTLSLVLGVEPTVGSSIEILTNTGTAPISDSFNGLAEGTVFTQGNDQYQITYQAGTGGDSIVLTRLA